MHEELKERPAFFIEKRKESLPIKRDFESLSL